MKNIILTLIALSLFSCKKKEPVKESVTVYVYSKTSNAKLKVFEQFIDVKNTTYSNSFEVSENEEKLSIRLENNVKSVNDSIFLRVSYKLKDQQQGMKLVNTIGNISFYLN